VERSRVPSIRLGAETQGQLGLFSLIPGGEPLYGLPLFVFGKSTFNPRRSHHEQAISPLQIKTA